MDEFGDLIEGVADVLIEGSDKKTRKGCFIFLSLFGLAFIAFMMFEKSEDIIKQKIANTEKTMEIVLATINLKAEVLTSERVDDWGNSFKITKLKKMLRYNIIIESAGPDKEFNTSDDLILNKTRFK